MLLIASCKQTGGEVIAPEIVNLDTANLRILESDIPAAPFCDLAFTNELIGYAVARNGRIMKTINAGLNWQQQVSPVNGLLSKIQFTDAQTGYILGSDDEGAFLLKTINGGALWQKIKIEVWDGGLPKSMYFLNNSLGFVCGGKNFLTTDDGGRSWQKVFSNDKGPFNDVSFRKNKGYVTTRNTYYYVTNDSGKHWTPVKTSEPLNDIYFSPHHDFAVIEVSEKLMNLNSGDNVLSPPSAKKLLFIDDKSCIGIGQHYEEGFWPYGDILLTNDLWHSFQHKKYSQSKAIEVTAIRRISKDKTLIIGNAPEKSIVVQLTHYKK